MYFVALNQQKAGPFTLDQLREMWRAGRVDAQTLFWENGMADWQPLERAATRLALPDLDSLRFAPPSAAGPLSPPATAHEPSAYDLPAAHLPAQPVPASTLATLPAAPLPAAPLPDGPHSLIAPTPLSAQTGTNPRPPLPPTALDNEVPPAAYVSLCCALCWPLLLILHVLGLVLSLGMMVAAVVCGHSARAAIRASGGRRPGMGIATAGMVLGYLSLALGVVMILVVLAGLAMFAFAYWQGTHH